MVTESDVQSSQVVTESDIQSSRGGGGGGGGVIGDDFEGNND